MSVFSRRRFAGAITVKKSGHIDNAQMMMLWTAKLDLENVIGEPLREVLNALVLD